MLYTEDNIKELYKMVNGGVIDARLGKLYAQIKKNIEVHTKGHLFDKVIKNFPNEAPEAQKQVISNYEPITKSGAWKGIDNIARIFGSTQFNVTASDTLIKQIASSKFYADYNNQWIYKSVASDPNSKAVWYNKDGRWTINLIPTEFIKIQNKNEIAFIDLENSEYTITEDRETQLSKLVGDGCCAETYYRAEKYNFTRTAYVYISKEQYITISEVKGDKNNLSIEANIINFKRPLSVAPYADTGVEMVSNGALHSPINAYLPFGNLALIKHRGFINAHNLFAYPRMEEVELPCEDCNQIGTIPCDCSGEDKCGSCNHQRERACPTCKGTKYVSIQSLFKIYKRRINGLDTNMPNDYPSAKFITPDVGIFEYMNRTWQEMLDRAERALYVQKQEDGGVAVSAEAREKMYQGMYSWLMRIANKYYSNLEHTLQILEDINGTGVNVEIEKPISYAIIGEMEGLNILNSIVIGDAPLFIKHSQVDNFIGRYFSAGNPIHKIVKVLKEVDIFSLYSSKDMSVMGAYGDLQDRHRVIHSYAYPLLMQLMAKDDEIKMLEVKEIVTLLENELGKVIPSKSVV